MVVGLAYQRQAQGVMQIDRHWQYSQALVQVLFSLALSSRLSASISQIEIGAGKFRIERQCALIGFYRGIAITQSKFQITEIDILDWPIGIQCQASTEFL